MTAQIIIPIEVRNPGAYLAACGVVEIIGAFDAASTSTWERRLVAFGSTNLSASVCIVQTSITEAELAVALIDALSCRVRWSASRLDGRCEPLDDVSRDEPLTAVRVSIRLGERQESFAIDHWYHRLARADDPKLKERLPEGKCVWKFWGGRMSLQKTLLGEGKKPGLITSLAAKDGGPPVAGIADLLSLERRTGSSLNLDAAARRGALDRGIAANEAKRATADVAAARPALELLAAIGLSAFFPPRRVGGSREAEVHGTAGFDGERFRYCAWGVEAPLSLARLLARGVELPGAAVLDRHEAKRVSAGGKNYRFEYARGTGLAEAALTEPEEEDDDDRADAD